MTPSIKLETNGHAGENARPPKRARVERKDYSTYIKDQDYYFTDGTICIAVEQTLFKVHQGILILRSHVFRNMFDMLRPVVGENGENDDTFDGVPLMELGDEAKDIRALFGMMYDGPPEDVPFDLIESVLRVSSKYEVE
ncbi:hypothetical protein FRB95_013999 [Tulasnella sp. JGI-2019a]|nr:hypothetical protein FRB95_013999 [Tulasnella sp. JGI-2019a]